MPNQQLAERIASSNDRRRVRELVDLLADRNKSIQSGCVKVLYEVGARKPELIAGYAEEFLALLESKNNRLVWGAMTALDAVTLENPKAAYGELNKILSAADKGSVITRDHAVGILTKLAGIKQYSDRVFTLVIERAKKARTDQLPIYAESVLLIVKEKNKALFMKTLSTRLDELSTPKRTRLEKVLKKLSALSG